MRNDLNMIEVNFAKIAKMSNVDNTILFFGKLIRLMNETGFSDKQIFILLYGSQVETFSQSEIFNLLGFGKSKVQFRDVFKTKNKLNYHEVIIAVEHDKKLKTNTKTYELTSYGRELAVGLLNTLKNID